MKTTFMITVTILGEVVSILGQFSYMEERLTLEEEWSPSSPASQVSVITVNKRNGE